MVKVLILFGIPDDTDEFDEHFAHSHRALLAALPEVARLVVNRVADAAVGNRPYHKIVEIHFDDAALMEQALNSEAGQAMARDYSGFATGGTTVLFCYSEPILSSA